MSRNANRDPVVVGGRLSPTVEETDAITKFCAANGGKQTRAFLSLQVKKQGESYLHDRPRLTFRSRLVTTVRVQSDSVTIDRSNALGARVLWLSPKHYRPSSPRHRLNHSQTPTELKIKGLSLDVGKPGKKAPPLSRDLLSACLCP